MYSLKYSLRFLFAAIFHLFFISSCFILSLVVSFSTLLKHDTPSHSHCRCRPPNPLKAKVGRWYSRVPVSVTIPIPFLPLRSSLHDCFLSFSQTFLNMTAVLCCTVACKRVPARPCVNVARVHQFFCRSLLCALAVPSPLPSPLPLPFCPHLHLPPSTGLSLILVLFPPSPTFILPLLASIPRPFSPSFLHPPSLPPFLPDPAFS